MRFDAPEHVDAWRSTGRFPVIHDAIVRLVQEEIDPRAGTVLDVGSSTGLLTRRLTDSGYVVAAAQEPGAALDAGRLAGLYDGVPVFDQRITPAPSTTSACHRRPWSPSTTWTTSPPARTRAASR